jgi:hypothetical protein
MYKSHQSANTNALNINCAAACQVCFALEMKSSLAVCCRDEDAEPRLIFDV